MQLDGGILNYLDYINKNKKKSLWDGDCFVFDNRTTVNKKLRKGKYSQCNGCRHPLTEQELNSKYFKKGISCPYCFTKRSPKQKLSSLTRQNQIEQAEKNNRDHPFKKLTLADY